MPGSIRVARIFGIDINVHVSWLLIFFLVFVTLADTQFPAYYPTWSTQKTFIVSAIAAFLFFASILAHELAHAIVARRFRMAVSSITLFLLGGVTNLKREPPSAKAEFLMAAAGPGTSVVIGALSLLIAELARSSLAVAPALQPVEAVARYLQINFWLAAFNLVPGFPLDGGRVLRSIVWGLRRDRLTATHIAARGGQVVAGLMLLGAALLVFRERDPGGGLWLGIIAYFLWNAATSSLQQERVTSVVGNVRVGQLMTTEFARIPSGTSVGTLIRDVMLPNNLRAVPVVSGDRMVGLVTIGDLRKVDQERWSMTRVDEVMTPINELQTVTPDEPLLTALERLGATELPLLPVMSGSSLAGLLHRESVVSYVRMREMLGLGERR